MTYFGPDWFVSAILPRGVLLRLGFGFGLGLLLASLSLPTLSSLVLTSTRWFLFLTIEMRENAAY